MQLLMNPDSRRGHRLRSLGRIREIFYADPLDSCREDSENGRPDILCWPVAPSWIINVIDLTDGRIWGMGTGR